MVFKFSDSKYQNEDDLLKKIDEEPIVLGANTPTDRALEMARDELFCMVNKALFEAHTISSP